MLPLPISLFFNVLTSFDITKGSKILQLDGQFMDTFSQRIEADCVL